MVVLVTCKNEEDPMKTGGDSILTSMGIFSEAQRAANSAVPFRIRPNFELIRDFMAVLVTCKNEKT